MNQKTKENIIFASKIILPIIVVIILFLGGVGAGIITFEPPEIAKTGEITATIIINFGDEMTYSNTFTLSNTTGFSILLKLEEQEIIDIETTYWESFGGYSVDSIAYEGKKYEADTSHYWAFYVNGEASMEGADKVYVNNNDIIEWRYESF